jgi:hypothetical protein
MNAAVLVLGSVAGAVAAAGVVLVVEMRKKSAPVLNAVRRNEPG